VAEKGAEKVWTCDEKDGLAKDATYKDILKTEISRYPNPLPGDICVMIPGT